ncbi:baseplate J/gp47 family protein [Salmonella enterica subsp. enterica serovar Saintpaul]|nr:baseplate J/gp47 family protein [Salmonella enterica subsp. enterica serovar Saintpaul]
MFQLKNFVSIAASMLNYVRSTTGQITDLQPGSVTRTILESPAAEIEELYIQVFNGIREAIPVAVYNSIQFDKLAPKYATGNVTIMANTPLTGDITIPAKTRFLARDGRAYVTSRDVIWQAKDSNGQNKTAMTVSVISVNTGSSQNVAVGDINSSPFFNPDQFTVIGGNITGGADLESDDARKVRFASYIQALSRGTREALTYGAMSAYLTDSDGNITEAVTKASVDDSSGHVVVYVWGSNGSPSKALLDRVTQIETGYTDANNQVIPGFTTAGIRTEFTVFDTVNVSATYRLGMQSGITQTPAIEQSVRDALSSFLSGVTAGMTIYVDDLRNAALSVRGVATADLVGFKSNIVLPNNQIALIGDLKFETPPLTASFTLTFEQGFTPDDTFQATAEKAIEDYLLQKPKGLAITMVDLTTAISALSGVKEVTVKEFKQNIILSSSSILVLGDLNFNLPKPNPAPQVTDNA